MADAKYQTKRGAGGKYVSVRYTTGRDAKSGQFIVDGKYLRKQAGEAVETFFAPLSGTFRAVTGKTGKDPRPSGKPKRGAA